MQQWPRHQFYTDDNHARQQLSSGHSAMAQSHMGGHTREPAAQEGPGAGDYPELALQSFEAATRHPTGESRQSRISSPDSPLFSHSNSTTTTTTTTTTETSWRPADLSRSYDELAATSLLAHDCQHQQQQQHSPTSMGHQHVGSASAADCGNSTSDGRLLLLNIPTDELNFSDIKEVWLVKSWQEILLRVSFVAPIVLLGLMGNLTIIYSMCRFKPIRSKPTNIFILNMALADLLTSIVCPNAALLTDIHQFYVLGSFICRFEGFIKITCLLVSAYSLIVLSFDWFLCVVKPCRRRTTIKQSWLTLVGIWVVSVAMALPLLYWRNLRERRWKDLVEVWCCEHIQYTKYYWVGMTLFLIYLPTFIMTIVLVVILAQMDKFEAKLKRSRRNTSAATHIQPGNSSSGRQSSSAILTAAAAPPRASLSASSAPPNDVSETLASNSSGPAGGRLNSSLSVSMKYRRRIVKILFFYLLTSIVCWTPLQFVIIYRHFRTEAVPANWFFELAFFSQLCASLSAAMNPIIFGFLSQPFRRVVTKSWMFRFLDKVWATNTRNRSEENGKNDQFIMHNRRPGNNIAGNNLNYAPSSQRLTRDLEQPKLTIDYVEHNDYLQPSSSRNHGPAGGSSNKRISIISTNHSHRHRSMSSHNHQHQQHHHHHHHHRHHHKYQQQQQPPRANKSNTDSFSKSIQATEGAPKFAAHRSHSPQRLQLQRQQSKDTATANGEQSCTNKQVSFNKNSASVRILTNGHSSSTSSAAAAAAARENEAYVRDAGDLDDEDAGLASNGKQAVFEKT